MEANKDLSGPAKETTLSSQVLDYYNKYSQSRQLPRYLCGTDSFSPEKVVDNLHTASVQTHVNIEQTSVGRPVSFD